MKKCNQILAVLFVFCLVLAATSVFASSDVDSVDYIRFPSGTTIYSPLNRTYYSNFLDLNLTFGAGLGISYYLKYSIDGKYEGSVPLVAKFPDELHVVNMMTGLVALPELSDGLHSLTIDVLCSLNNYHGANPPGLPFTPTYPGSSDYTANYTHIIYFSINTKIPEFPSWVFLPLFITATFSAMVIKKRLFHQRTKDN